MRPVAQAARFYRICVRQPVRCPTPVNANRSCNRRLCAAFVLGITSHVRRLYPEESWSVDPSNTVHAFVAATIDLSHPVFPWAQICLIKAEIRLHMSLALRGAAPHIIHVTDGKPCEINTRDRLAS